MFGSEILDVAIGLSLIYLLLSAMASALREALEAWFKTRSQHLERGIRELLQDPDGSWLARGIYEHPLVAGLFKGEYSPRPPGLTAGNALFWLFGRSNLPSYIPASNFAAALMDVVARGPVTPEDAFNSAPPPELTVRNLRAVVERMGNPYLQRALLVAIDRGERDANKVQANLEAWYNSAMDRVSGWYKRRTQWVLLIIGLGLAIGLNVNTITVASYLLRDNTAREALVAQAQAMSRDTGIVRGDYNYNSLHARLDSLDLPIGWEGQKSGPRLVLRPSTVRNYHGWTHFWLPIFGWLITALAVSLGAPFWFDVLNKFMVIRSTVKPHEKSPEEASEDRQRKGSQQSPQRIGGGLPGGGGDGGGGDGDGGDDGGGDSDDGGGGGDGGGGTGGPGAGGPGAGGAGGGEQGDPEANFEPHQWQGERPEEGVL